MVFEYQPGQGFDYMKEFAERFKLPLSDNTLEFTSFIGKGFIKTIHISEDFRVVLNKIDHKNLLVIRKKAIDYSNDYLVFRFMYVVSSDRNYLSNVRVVNNFVETEDTFEGNMSVCYVVVSIKAGVLLSLLDLGEDMEELTSFISNFSAPFLYQETITPEMKTIIRELVEHANDDKLEKFYYKTKISELIYLFFSHFLRRRAFDFGSVNKGDIEKILYIEKLILKDLSTVPVLSDLARTVGMSETKMKLLFRKIFENSIYNYYSNARMIEAASMLKNYSNISVSEVGYSLGFSNLSHFAKMFKRYIGMRPKEYAMRVYGEKPKGRIDL